MSRPVSAALHSRKNGEEHKGKILHTRLIQLQRPGETAKDSPPAHQVFGGSTSPFKVLEMMGSRRPQTSEPRARFHHDEKAAALHVGNQVPLLPTNIGDTTNILGDLRISGGNPTVKSSATHGSTQSSPAVKEKKPVHHRSSPSTTSHKTISPRGFSPRSHWVISEEENKELRKQIELEHKRISILEAQLHQTKQHLQATTERQHHLNKENDALRKRIHHFQLEQVGKEQPEEEEQEEEEVSTPQLVEDFQTRGGDSNLASKQLERYEEEIKQTQDEAVLVFQVLGTVKQRTYTSTVEQRDFFGLKDLFIDVVKKYLEKTRELRGQLKQATHGQPGAEDGTPVRRSSMVGDGVIGMYKKQIEDYQRQIVVLKSSTDKACGEFKCLANRFSELVTKALGGLRAHLNWVGELKNLLTRKGSQMIDVETLLRDAISDVFERTDSVGQLAVEVTETLTKGNVKELTEVVQQIVADCNAEKRKVLKGKNDEHFLQIYMEEMQNYRQYMNETIRSGGKQVAAIQTEISLDVRSDNVLKIQPALSTPSHRASIDDSLAPTWGESTEKPSLLKDNSSAPTRRSVMTYLIEAVTLASSVSLQTIFGPAPLVPSKHQLVSSIVNLDTKRRHVLENKNYFPRQLSDEDEEVLWHNQSSVLLLLDMYSLWEKSLGIKVRHCHQFIALVRHAPGITQSLAANQSQYQKGTENVYTKFAEFLKGIVYSNPREAQHIVQQVRQLSDIKNAQAKVNWRGLVNLYKLQKMKTVIQEAIGAQESEKEQVLQRFYAEAVQDAVEMRKSVQSTLHLNREAIWSALLEALIHAEKAVLDSGLDLMFMQRLGPSVTPLLVQAVQHASAESNQEFRKIFKKIQSYQFDERWYVRNSTEFGLDRMFAGSSPVLDPSRHEPPLSIDLSRPR